MKYHLYYNNVYYFFQDEQPESLSEPSTPLSSCYSEHAEKSSRGSCRSTNRNSSLSHKKAKFLDAANFALTAPEKPISPFEPFGKSVAVDLENMDARQRICAQKIISDVLFYGKLGRLTENCTFRAPTHQHSGNSFQNFYDYGQNHATYYGNQFATQPATLVSQPQHNTFYQQSTMPVFQPPVTQLHDTLSQQPAALISQPSVTQLHDPLSQQPAIQESNFRVTPIQHDQPSSSSKNNTIYYDTNKSDVSEFLQLQSNKK